MTTPRQYTDTTDPSANPPEQAMQHEEYALQDSTATRAQPRTPPGNTATRPHSARTPPGNTETRPHSAWTPPGNTETRPLSSPPAPVGAVAPTVQPPRNHRLQRGRMPNLTVQTDFSANTIWLTCATAGMTSRQASSMIHATACSGRTDWCRRRSNS